MPAVASFSFSARVTRFAPSILGRYIRTARIATMSAQQFLTDREIPICKLEVKKHFDDLTTKEKFYAHYLGAASWAGSKVILDQTSPESAALFDLFLTIFRAPDNLVSTQNVKDAAGVTDEEWTDFIDYVTMVIGNMGNFRAFGDSKILPRVSPAVFEKVVASAKSEKATALYQQVKEVLHSSDPAGQLLLGFPTPDGHVSGYYTRNLDKAEIDFVQGVLDANNISALNTRLFKTFGEYNVMVASAVVPEGAEKVFTVDGKTIKVKYGDFAAEMKASAAACRAAIPYAANENQEKMLAAYAESFETGSIEAHKESQRWWIKDIGPAVESNIGFIESYQDPAGTRAAWEGFTACVNKEQTAKFNALVENAPKFITHLPWPKDFEKDKFNKPDFTSLEVIQFTTSGLPAGINIPNYDDVRQTLGFKNVSLGNVLSAVAPKEKITFIREEDLELFTKLRGPAFEVQVGIHELLGHGTGKLLMEETAGKYNFDINNPPVSPVTGKPATTWYKPGETWSSVFKAISASYEECRAECVAMYLCPQKEIVNIFLHGEEEKGDDVIYIAWLQMARAGVTSLEFYDPKSKKARYAILKCFLQAGQDFVKVERTADDDIKITLDRTKIESVGVPAVGDFLTKLHVYKSTADVEAGGALYAEMTAVDDLLPLRDIVIARKQPRKVFVQANTFVKDGDVVLKEYPATVEGLIQSWVDRY